MNWWKRTPHPEPCPEIAAAHREALATKKAEQARQSRLRLWATVLDEIREENHVSMKLDKIFGGER